MIVRTLLCLALAATMPLRAFAASEVSDWTGAKVQLTEGDVVNGGVKIHYHAAGGGPLVVLVHGFAEYWFDWRQQIPSLAKEYTVVAISLRGTDESDKPPAVDDYSAAAVATDLDAVIRHFGQQKAIVIGFSTGGFYAWYFAMHYPERVDRLVSIGAYHPANLVREYATNPAQAKVGQYSRNYQDNPSAAADLARQQRNPNAPLRPADTPEIRQMRLEAAQRTWWEGTADFYKANWPSAPYTLDSPAFGGHGIDYPKVKAPTLVIYGREDAPLLVSGLNELWKWVDNELTTLVLPGRGHAVHNEVPEFVTPRLVNWLSTRSQPSLASAPAAPGTAR